MFSPAGSKKAKRLKYKYNKKRKCESDVEDSDTIVEEEVKLKVKIPTDTKRIIKTGLPTLVEKSKKKKKKGEPSGEEERWLDAIKSGNLHEVDEELKHMNDRKVLTARQRALLERKLTGTTKPKHKSATPAVVVTEEMKRVKALKTQMRQQQAREKREKNKKQTLAKLLKKQDVKPTKVAKTKAVVTPSAKNIRPMISYRHTINLTTLSFPKGSDYPLQPQKSRTPPPPVLCGVSGCKNMKKYSCSKTGVNLCSLECYKSNLKLQTAVT